MNKYWLWLCCVLLMTHWGAKAQTSTWNTDGSVTVSGGEQTFTSLVPATTKDIDDIMLHLNYSIPFTNLGNENPGGIQTSNQNNGEVTLKVYAYDSTKTGGKGQLVYGCKSSKNGFYGDGWTVNINQYYLNRTVSKNVIVPT